MPKKTENTESNPFAEADHRWRGHGFLPSSEERALIPTALGQDDLPEEETVVHLHYFSPSADWWLTELWEDDERPGRWWAFGFARLITEPAGGEWGRIDLNRLATLRFTRPGAPPQLVERDLAWRPTPFGECDPGTTQGS